MNFKIETTPHFERELKDLAKRYKSIKQDFGNFIASLKENPFQGADLGGGLRQIPIFHGEDGHRKENAERLGLIVQEESNQKKIHENSWSIYGHSCFSFNTNDHELTIKH